MGKGCLVLESSQSNDHAQTTLVPGTHMCFTWASWVSLHLGFGHYCPGLPVGAQMRSAHKPYYLKYITNTSKLTHL